MESEARHLYTLLKMVRDAIIGRDWEPAIDCCNRSIVVASDWYKRDPVPPVQLVQVLGLLKRLREDIRSYDAGFAGISLDAVLDALGKADEFDAMRLM